MVKLDHVALEVSDMEDAIAFYTRKLGLKLISSKVDEIHHEAFAFLKLEGANLELLQMLDKRNRPKKFVPNPARASNCPHVALATSDMAKLMDLLEREEIPIVKGPLEIPGEVRWIYVQDPDQNILEFVEWL
jgi:catechol 2,3-dioxygenase-like lactoylglutathione lyase family enzyme